MTRIDLSRLRIGQGSDLHRLVKDRPLILGGIPIPESELGCLAHSDGDVLLHALIDALLGAAGMGDIGVWFPPSDLQWQGADSQALLTQTLSGIKQNHPDFQLINVDATIHLETPKLKNRKEEIRQSLARQLNLPASQINIKAKTAEGMDAVGQQQAIRADVTLLALL